MPKRILNLNVSKPNGLNVSTPLVSVIVPNYNHGRFLKGRIDSILAQTYSNFELIILDDASQDNSLEIIESFRNHDKISQIVINKINSGNTFSQWKKGLEFASGEWIWWAESDDLCEPEFLSACMERSSSAGLVFTSSQIIDDEGLTSTYLNHSQWPNASAFHVYKDANELVDSKDFLIQEMYRFNHLMNASAVVIKKSCLPDLENLTARFVLCGDWYLWVQILSNVHFEFVDKPLNKFRVHGQTQRMKYENDIRVYFENVEIVHFIHSRYPSSANRKAMSDYLIYIYFNRYGSAERKGTFIKFLSSLRPLGWIYCFHGLKNRWIYA